MPAYEPVATAEQTRSSSREFELDTRRQLRDTLYQGDLRTLATTLEISLLKMACFWNVLHFNNLEINYQAESLQELFEECYEDEIIVINQMKISDLELESELIHRYRKKDL